MQRFLDISHGFCIAGFPGKIHAASASWTRAVAIFTDERKQEATTP